MSEGPEVRIRGCGFRSQGLRLGLRVSGCGAKLRLIGFRAQGFRFGVLGSRLKDDRFGGLSAPCKFLFAQLRRQSLRGCGWAAWDVKG